MILQIQRGLREDGITVPMTKLCRWFDVPQRTVYHSPLKPTRRFRTDLLCRSNTMIEAEPSFGYRTDASLPRFNQNTVQRVFQLMGWQVRKRAIGHRPRIEALPSVATTPNERWETDLCRLWAGRDGWQTLALVIDCHTRELLGWQISRSGRASTATAALEQALIARFGSLGRVYRSFLLTSVMGWSSPRRHIRGSCAATVVAKSSLRRTARSRTT
jgi:putative transposase